MEYNVRVVLMDSTRGHYIHFLWDTFFFIPSKPGRTCGIVCKSSIVIYTIEGVEFDCGIVYYYGGGF